MNFTKQQTGINAEKLVNSKFMQKPTTGQPTVRETEPHRDIRHPHPRQQTTPQTFVEPPPEPQTRSIKIETPVLQPNNSAVTARTIFIVIFSILLLLLIFGGIWNLHSHQKHTQPIYTNQPHDVRTDLASPETVAKIYSVFYPYEITKYNEWERIPAATMELGPSKGIGIINRRDYHRIVSLHSCCMTKQKIFVCANTNRIDGNAFDIRLVEFDQHILLEVFSVTQLLVGSQCKLEIELQIEN